MSSPLSFVGGTFGDSGHYPVIQVDKAGKVISAYVLTLGSGTGTVTSVGLTGDGTVFSSTESGPVTTAGTLALTLISQGVGTVLAGPLNGDALAPTFRVLAPTDLPITITADGYASTITFSMATSNIHEVTLTGDATLAVSNVAVGQIFRVRLLQDGTGTRTVTWWSGIKWPSGVVPTLTLTAAKADAFEFVCRATGVYDGFILGQNL
jgi:hypothetical protein